MSPELDWTLVVLARTLTVHLILLTVSAVATLFLTVLTHFRAESLLNMLKGAKVYTLPPDDKAN